MATFKSFEDIEAWQKARSLTREIYGVSNGGLFAKDFGLRDQIRRASVSIMSNIAEGFERGGAKEFGRFLAMAKESAGEVSAQLWVAYDQGYINATLSDLSDRATEIGRQLGGLMNYLDKIKK